uniref:Uncharacterized protein n=1 Tax=viral metagenome TaxID=1070528 RepID=A0A6H1ZN61_9ZZZZ
MSKSQNIPNDPNYIIGENSKRRLFAKGNTIGRMPKKGFTLTDLNKLIRKYEETHDKPILKHYIEQLFKDNRLLDKYIDKNVPTKTINELTGAGGSPLIFIIEKTYQGENDKPKDTSEVNP